MFRRLSLSEMLWMILPMAIGIALPIWVGVPISRVVLGVIIALLVGSGSAFLPGSIWLLAMFVVGLGGSIGWMFLESSSAVGICGGTAYFCGFAMGGHFRAGREERVSPADRRPVAAERMVRDIGAEDEMTPSLSEKETRAAIDVLDGKERTTVSLYRGTARLDVAGDAHGPMMVYQCDDTTARRPEWSHLTSPRVSGADDVVVQVNRIEGYFPAWMTTSIEPARMAVSEFVRSGQRAAGLNWRTDPEVTDLRPFDED